MAKYTLPLNWQEDFFEKINFDNVIFVRYHSA